MPDNGPDIADLVLGQAVMVAMAVPAVGPELAAAFSILDAVYNAFMKQHPQPSYSVAQAISDLGTDIDKSLQKLALDDRFAKIRSWQQAAIKTSSDISRASDELFLKDPVNRKTLEQGIEDFHNDKSYDEVFGWFDELTGEDEVSNLDLYFIARTAYQNNCYLKLQLNALLEQHKYGGLLKGYAETPNSIIDDYARSLNQAIAYGTPKWKALDHAFKHSVEEARAQSVKDHPTPGPERTLAFSALLNGLRHDAHLECTSEARVERISKFLLAFQRTLLYLDPFTADNQKQVDDRNIAAAAAASRAVRARDLKAMGPKPSTAVRFLFETSDTDTWVDVFSDSALVQGSVATQNAGSTNAGIYYQVGGEFLNGIFKAALDAAGQLTTVNAAIAKAYDDKYKPGDFVADGGAKAPRQDRLTSFIVPVTPDTPPIGASVYAMVYSVGPQLGTGGIVDKQGYKQIYLDAFAEIARWNKKYTKATISSFRITMLSTGAYGDGSTKLRQDSAALIIQAVRDAVKADPSLAALTILVNSNYTTDPALEPAAFEAAAKAALVSTNRAGFDLSIT